MIDRASSAIFPTRRYSSRHAPHAARGRAGGAAAGTSSCVQRASVCRGCTRSAARARQALDAALLHRGARGCGHRRRACGCVPSARAGSVPLSTQSKMWRTAVSAVACRLHPLKRDARVRRRPVVRLVGPARRAREQGARRARCAAAPPHACSALSRAPTPQAWKHPEAEKLFVEEVDVGEAEPRQARAVALQASPCGSQLSG
jgi:hypothetical protein